MTPRVLIRAAVSALATCAAQAALRAGTRGSDPWERTNYRGRTVRLTGGVAAAGTAVVAAAVAPRPVRGAALVATTVAAAAGAADDFAPDPGAAKGLKGHLRALSEGRVTTGLVKLLGISGAGVAAAALLGRGTPMHPATRVVDAVAGGALIAGTANLVNLFDLRPGRAVKMVAALAAGVTTDRTNPAGAALAASALGISAGAAPSDLAETTMLGDVGANSLGALLGVACAAHPNRGVRTALVAAVTLLILASEKVSFSRVIEGSPVLSWLDRLGRT